MSVHTKTRPTNGPVKQKKEANIPWRKVFKKEIDKYGEAGLALRGLRARENLTQKALAERLNIAQHHISEMENKKRSIGKEMARRLAKEFNVSYKIFL